MYVSFRSKAVSDSHRIYRHHRRHPQSIHSKYSLLLCVWDYYLVYIQQQKHPHTFTMADVEETPVEETPVEEPEVEEEEEFVAVGGAAEVKLFGKWSFDDIEIRDISLEVSTTRLPPLNWTLIVM